MYYLNQSTRHQITVTRHLFFLPFIVNEDIRNVIVKTLISIKLKGDKAPNLNILFILQNLQGTFAESTRHHWKLEIVPCTGLFILQNLQGTFAESTRHHWKLCIAQCIYHTSLKHSYLLNY